MTTRPLYAQWCLLAASILSLYCSGKTETEEGGSGGFTGAISCPAMSPGLGSTCAIEGQACQYDNCSLTGTWLTFTCATGTWHVNTMRICLDCPDDIVAGAPCDPAVYSESCMLTDVCGTRLAASCREGTWSAFTPLPTGGSSTTGFPQPEPSRCPTNLPTLEAECCPDLTACRYTDGILDFGSTTGTTTGSTTGGQECRFCSSLEKWQSCN